MLVEVLIDNLWHKGHRQRKGELIEMSERGALADAKRGLVKVLPIEDAGTAPERGDDGEGNIPSDAEPEDSKAGTDTSAVAALPPLVSVPVFEGAPSGGDDKPKKKGK